jgi:hypothetical protein
MHDGTLYPISGEGFHQLNRGAYKAPHVLNKMGQTGEAQRVMDLMKIPETEREAAVTAWTAAQ